MSVQIGWWDPDEERWKLRPMDDQDLALQSREYEETIRWSLRAEPMSEGLKDLLATLLRQQFHDYVRQALHIEPRSTSNFVSLSIEEQQKSRQEETLQRLIDAIVWLTDEDIGPYIAEEDEE